jgi:1-acyl-sn-glycerol-3-phosphate acyltransferase
MSTSENERIVHQALFFDEGHGYDVFGLHPPALASVVETSHPLYDRYFRVESIGSERIPTTGPVIIVANHGGVLPVDSAMLCLDIIHRTNPPRIPRAIADWFVPRLPLFSTLFARVGVVAGTRENVRCLLERGELVAIWPEGVSGPAKPFRSRYEIQHWSVGFAELAMRYHAPVIPVAVIGAEESWPVLARFRSLRMFGAPYLPIPMSPIPLPAHYHIRYGAPIVLDDDPEDPSAVHDGAETVRAVLEQMIADARDARRGVFR